MHQGQLKVQGNRVIIKRFEAETPGAKPRPAFEGSLIVIPGAVKELSDGYLATIVKRGNGKRMDKVPEMAVGATVIVGKEGYRIPLHDLFELASIDDILAVVTTEDGTPYVPGQKSVTA